MNQITFPIINLKLNISPIAFTIGGIDIYWYAIIMVSAFIMALIIFKIKDGKYNIKFADIIDLAIYLIPISILSARIYYCLFNLKYYIANPMQILNFRTGGLAIYGGIIGGAITCIIFGKIKKINLLDLLDYIVPCLALGQAIGRWGNFVNVEAYGYETTLPWRMGIYEAGKYIEVHPTFLYESIATLIIFILLTIKQRKFKGEICYLYIILYSFERMILENLRTDSLMLGNLRISQTLSEILFIIFLTIYILNYKKTQKNCE